MALMVYTLVCSICNIVMITVQLIMMINKMLAHWKIARCARASQLYHRGPPLKLGDLRLPGPGPFKQSDVITKER